MSQRVIRISEIATIPASQGRPKRKGKVGKPDIPAIGPRAGKLGILPVSPATIWRWVREDKFPKPFKLGESVTVWDAAEVEAFIARRSTGSMQ